MELPTARKRRLAAWLSALVGLVACGTLIAPQQWDEARGPVVPHDSFPADCRLCHLGEGWHEIRPDFAFDHAAETGVALDGAHEHAQCLRCHNDRGPVEVFAARGCGGCHVDPHRGRLGGACASCHVERDWIVRDVIEQHARTRLPLVGAHAAAQCFQCHPGAEVGNFEGLDPDCATCHASDLSRATSPDHAAQGWTADCQRCHVPLDWRPAHFGHPSSFPLTGGHSGLDCAACHSGGSFLGAPTDCVACHRDDYDGTSDPNHAASGFSTQCALCHTTTTWSGARFDHRFPIDRGAHAAVSCNECHTTAPPAFSCTDCHEHNRTETDDDHREVSGYVYASPDCYRCHPDGRH